MAGGGAGIKDGGKKDERIADGGLRILDCGLAEEAG